MVGVALTVVMTTLGVARDYRARSAEIAATLDSIQITYLPAVTQSAFQFSRDQLSLLLEGIVLLRDVSYAVVVETGPGGDLIMAEDGVPRSTGVVRRRYPLSVVRGGEERLIGRLEVHAEEANLRALVGERLGMVLISSSLQVFAVAILVFIVTDRAVIRHLRSTTSYLGTIRDPSDARQPLRLARRPRNDELSDIVGAINSAHRRLADTVAEKETLLQELYHRTKNNMQTIGALLEMRAAGFPGNEAIRSLVRDTRTRIAAMAMVHEKLYRSSDLSHIPVGGYVRDLVDSVLAGYGSDNVTATVDAEDGPMLIDTAIPLGLVVCELVANSLQHAFPHRRSGTVRVTISSSVDGTRVLQYSDDGVGLPEGFRPREHGGVGFQTLISLCERQLDGAIRFNSGPGFSCVITVSSERYEQRV